MKYYTNRIATPFGNNSTLSIAENANGHIHFRFYSNSDYEKISESWEQEETKSTKLLISEHLPKVLDLFSPVLEAAESVFGVNNVILISDNIILDDKKVEGIIQIYLYMSNIYVTNEYGIKTPIRDLVVELILCDIYNKNGVNTYVFEFSIKGMRYTLSIREKYRSYQHSHLNGISPYPSNFCLGRSELASMLAGSIEVYKLDYLMYLIHVFCETESLKGIPYRRIDSIINVNEILEKISGVSRNITVTMEQAAGTLKNILEHKDLNIGYEDIGGLGGQLNWDESNNDIVELCRAYAPDSLRSGGKMDAKAILGYRSGRNAQDLKFGDVLLEKQVVTPDDEELKLLDDCTNNSKKIIPDRTLRLLSKEVSIIMDNYLSKITITNN